jgi:hypothetical protein
MMIRNETPVPHTADIAGLLEIDRLDLAAEIHEARAHLSGTFDYAQAERLLDAPWDEWDDLEFDVLRPAFGAPHTVAVAEMLHAGLTDEAGDMHAAYEAGADEAAELERQVFGGDAYVNLRDIRMAGVLLEPVSEGSER